MKGDTRAGAGLRPDVPLPFDSAPFMDLLRLTGRLAVALLVAGAGDGGCPFGVRPGASV